jgi:ATP-dependent DNA helicase RecQ
MFSPAVYDDLRQRYTNRIHAMIDYVQTANECRSRQLLRYFGEKNDHDCGQCDVCMSYKRQLTDNGKTQSASQLILDLLADGQQHHVTELRQLPLPYEQIDAALGQLMLEEDVYMDGAYLTKAK